MNSSINLHWNNEVCIADGLQKDAKHRKDSKLKKAPDKAVARLPTFSAKK